MMFLRATGLTDALTVFARRLRPRSRWRMGGLLVVIVLICPRTGAVPLDGGADASLPLWEINLFYGAVRLPHYRGSDQFMVYSLPLPYLVYRGDMLRVDREGLRGIFRESERVETGISVSGQPPPYRGTRARENMDSIGAIFEVGPMLKYFAAGRDRENPLYLSVAVRPAVSVDPESFRFAARGGRADVEAVYRNRRRWRARDGSFGMRLAFDFADQRYNAYLYDVAPHEASATRPAYRARGGYAGASLSVSAQTALSDRWTLGGYYRWDNLSGAVYRDSPLVKTVNNHTVGCALIWNLLQSRERVSR